MRNPSVSWDSLVSCERPDLARSSGYFGDSAGCERQDNNERHDVSAGVGVSGVEEHLDKWVPLDCVSHYLCNPDNGDFSIAVSPVRVSSSAYAP